MPAKLQSWRGGLDCSASSWAMANSPASASPMAAEARLMILKRVMVRKSPGADASSLSRGWLLRQHGVRDRGRNRLRFLDEAEQRHDHDKEAEIADGADPRDQCQSLRRLLRAEPAEHHANGDEHPEEEAIDRSILRRLDRRPVEPGHEGQHHDRR